ncbi:hypothetical protein WR25_12747 [Diploscapter pachys]|uniref:G-protein coupled receptors family 1 profile domain-containing protein n=1 Tax=Diploscapter pachys TaxID=2018661 RepID=A0A2A2JV58_9BILA|nr:hypothetical protein WR25_12747 [Diploscapter pachys]
MIVLQDHHIAALCVFLVSSCGMTANWFITIFIRRLKSLQNPFGWLTGSQAIGEAVHNSLFCLYFVPMVFFDIEWMKEYSRHCGHVLLICYDITIYSHLFISLNRMCAIFFPLKYNRIFSYRNTMTAIVISWILAIVPSFYFYVYEDCKFLYAGDFYHFVFTTTPICLFITWYTDFLKYVSIVVIICVLDIITVARVHFARLAACLQAAVFVCELITYFILEAKVQEKWSKFFLSTVAWVFVHCSDGFITIIFNREFRTVIPCACMKRSVQIRTTRDSTRPPAGNMFTVSSSRSRPTDSIAKNVENCEVYGANSHDMNQRYLNYLVRPDDEIEFVLLADSRHADGSEGTAHAADVGLEALDVCIWI